MDYGAIIQRRRKQAGVSQTQLGSLADPIMSQFKVQEIENGKSVEMEAIARLGRALFIITTDNWNTAELEMVEEEIKDMGVG